MAVDVNQHHINPLERTGRAQYELARNFNVTIDEIGFADRNSFSWLESTAFDPPAFLLLVSLFACHCAGRIMTRDEVDGWLNTGASDTLTPAKANWGVMPGPFYSGWGWDRYRGGGNVSPRPKRR